MRIDYRDLSVFARDGEGGNPLAIVDHTAIASTRWQEVAAAIGYSETVFLEPGDPATVHIYTPGRRIPFAGHPLVGTAATLSPDQELIRYDTGVANVRRDAAGTYVTVVSEGESREASRPAFGVLARIVEMPLEYLVVQCESAEVVAGLSLDDVAGHEKIYVWAWEVEGEIVRSRFFAPGVGVPEDPATGSAAVALARFLGWPQGGVVIHQGEEVGSPSRIELAWTGPEVTIGGEVLDRGLGGVDLD
ncbi:MAG TPA: PhzF family phenazine biosynthesis protein [Acidimicrobiia bacterium]|nr:PhzF family phenazine biosynthesis protein [Acidimicrobiia bacterium]